MSLSGQRLDGQLPKLILFLSSGMLVSFKSIGVEGKRADVCSKKAPSEGRQVSEKSRRGEQQAYV